MCSYCHITVIVENYHYKWFKNKLNVCLFFSQACIWKIKCMSNYFS